MNDLLLSLFLAHVLGFFFLILAVIMLVKKKYYRDMIIKTKPGSSVIAVASTMGLILGLILVLVHNIWLWESEVMITIIAWLILIKSIAYLAFPGFMIRMAQSIYSNAGYYLVAVVMGIIGILLLAHGTYLFIPPVSLPISG